MTSHTEVIGPTSGLPIISGQDLAREWRRRLPRKGLTRSECLFHENAVVVIDRSATHVRVAGINRGVDGRALF